MVRTTERTARPSGPGSRRGRAAFAALAARGAALVAACALAPLVCLAPGFTVGSRRGFFVPVFDPLGLLLMCYACPIRPSWYRLAERDASGMPVRCPSSHAEGGGQRPPGRPDLSVTPE
ncbi:MAG: hypothetical protein AAFR44_08210 [Pseudomonadota bacterium]